MSDNKLIVKRDDSIINYHRDKRAAEEYLRICTKAFEGGRDTAPDTIKEEIENKTDQELGRLYFDLECLIEGVTILHNGIQKRLMNKGYMGILEEI